MTAHLFGIRHHGPGSARSLLAALEELQPQAVLIEGPPEAEDLLPLLADEAMRPPVAVLLYAADDAAQASFDPFAVYSPEWQALRFAASRQIPVRFIDLPQSIGFALSRARREEAGEDHPPPARQRLHHDPLDELARAAGFEDGESWWEAMVEQRRQPGSNVSAIFAAIAEAMATLRSGLPPREDAEEARREQLREAFMRQCLRKAEREFERVAVVCGAWHVPALQQRPPARDDAALLKGLPRVAVRATCIPWTHARLSRHSGYGAGVESPGWYHHLWTTPERPLAHWVTTVARLLRGEGLDAPPASLIETVRLAEALAALRDRAAAGLAELQEATLAVLCHGDPAPLRVIERRLVVGDHIGSVSAHTPAVPLQQDVRDQQRRLRLKPSGEARSLDLDLRLENDRARSRLLHRLRLLGVGWGEGQAGSQQAKGTFHELWTLQWQPEFEITLIERGAWGNTLEAAASAWVLHQAAQATGLPAITALVHDLLLAELPEAAAGVVSALQQQAALATDVAQLMAALPPLARVLRYGNVRSSETGMVEAVVRGMLSRIAIGLPAACASLDDEAARGLFEALQPVHDAVALLEDVALSDGWHAGLQRLAAQNGLHGLIAGRTVRLLLDARRLDHEEAARRLSLALSPASDPTGAAAWCEGFLHGSGFLLVHDERLRGLLDAWIAGLTAEAFEQQLPILRRTFATFHAPERRQLGEFAARGAAVTGAGGDADFDPARAQQALPVLAQVLGLETGNGEREA